MDVNKENMEMEGRDEDGREMKEKVRPDEGEG